MMIVEEILGSMRRTRRYTLIAIAWVGIVFIFALGLVVWQIDKANTTLAKSIQNSNESLVLALTRDKKPEPEKIKLADDKLDKVLAKLDERPQVLYKIRTVTRTKKVYVQPKKKARRNQKKRRK